MNRTLRVAATLATVAIATLPFSAISADGYIRFNGTIFTPTEALDTADLRQLIRDRAAVHAWQDNRTISIRPISDVVSAEGTGWSPVLDYYVASLRDRAVDLKGVRYVVVTYR
jgi:hypothetical protein